MNWSLLRSLWQRLQEADAAFNRALHNPWFWFGLLIVLYIIARAMRWASWLGEFP